MGYLKSILNFALYSHHCKFSCFEERLGGGDHPTESYKLVKVILECIIVEQGSQIFEKMFHISMLEGWYQVDINLKRRRA